MRRPITQKAKSPLKQVDMTKTSSSTSAGEDIISEVTTRGPADDYDGSGGYETPEKWAAWLKTPAGQKYVAKFGEDGKGALITEKVVTPGKPITETKTNSYTPQVRDETTAITPWENRFNMRTSRQSERFARNEAKRDLRRNAKEAARDTRQDGGSFLEGRKARRDIMTGKSFQNDMQENLYNASRGLNADQNRVFSTDAQQSQFEQAATRGEKVLGSRRNMDIYDAGTSKGATTVKNLQALDPDYKLKLGNNEKVTTTGGEASKANSGAPTTNKVNGTGASSKASMRPSVGLNAEFKGASVPSVDLVASRNTAQADATMPTPVTVTPKSNVKDADAKAAEKSARQATRANKKQARMANRGQVDKDGNVITRKEMRQNRKAGKAAYKADQELKAAINQVGANASKYESNLESVPDSPDNVKFSGKKILADRKALKTAKDQVGANANSYESNLESVPEAPDNVKFSGNEIIADRKAKALAQANSMKANTGTADRSSYNRTSPGLSDGTPTRKDSDRSIVSAAQMRYESNVGVKKSTPMKKGYFKSK